MSGAGRLVGLDNGDSTDFDQYKGTSRRLFSGKLLAMVAAKQEPGQIRFSVSSPGLGTEELVLKRYHARRYPVYQHLLRTKIRAGQRDTDKKDRAVQPWKEPS